ncbi:MAG: peptidyl-prolyl cis-trans isomerase [Chloroflexota bacterium]|nr:MAG: peptidyl-prolyl cis-trans isomerase [Chloroflexota bacterium]
MTDTMLKVADGMVVSLDYTLRLDDGQVIDSSNGREALQFLQGQGQIIPGLEQALYGMEVGEEKEVEVAPGDGYGETDPDAYQMVPHDLFPADMELSEGMGLRMRDESGQPLEAYVANVSPDGVLLDFNHPLAGETLYFHVKIADLRPGTSEELDHGHVHN